MTSFSYQELIWIVDVVRFPRQCYTAASLKTHFCDSLPLHSKYSLSTNHSSSLYSTSACQRKGLKLREQWPSHCSFILGSYHRLFPGVEKAGYWRILSRTGEMTSGSDRSLMVGSNRAFHGRRPCRRCASSYPRSSPGTPIQWGPEAKKSSVTASQSLPWEFHLSESSPIKV